MSAVPQISTPRVARARGSVDNGEPMTLAFTTTCQYKEMRAFNQTASRDHQGQEASPLRVLLGEGGGGGCWPPKSVWAVRLRFTDHGPLVLVSSYSLEFSASVCTTVLSVPHRPLLRPVLGTMLCGACSLLCYHPIYFGLQLNLPIYVNASAEIKREGGKHRSSSIFILWRFASV